MIVFNFTGLMLPLFCSNLYCGDVMPGIFGDLSVIVATSRGWSGVRRR